MEQIDQIINRCKNKQDRKIKINKKWITKLLISIIFLFSSLIYIKISEDNKLFFKEKLFSESLSFTKINNWYTNYFGDIVPITNKTEVVFSGSINYTNIEDYYDGQALTVSSLSPISNLIGGVVVFIGEKENYGNTVIIQGNDGYDIWYSNLTNISVNLYDYIENETIIGETVDDKLYLVIKKENEFIKYESYKN